MTKKIIILLIILSFLTIWKSNNTKAIMNISVDVYPNTVNEIAEYTINLMLEKKIGVHQWIHVQFPKEVILPELPEDPIERDKKRKEIIENMFIFDGYGNACTGLPIIDYDQNLFMFHTTCSDGEPFQDLKIIFKSKIGIRNPEKEGEYKIKFRTQKEQTFIESSPYSIFESKIGNGTELPRAVFSRPSIKQKSDFTIKFKLGNAGLLKFGDGRIYLTFPEEFKLPDILPEFNFLMICINNNFLSRDIETIEGNTLFIPVNQKYSPNSYIEIFIKKEFGIINPEIAGEYQIAVYTKPSDPTPVLSEPFTIYDSPSLEVYPQNANSTAEYVISYVSDNNTQLYTKDIIVKFPPGTNFLKNPSNYEILINNIPVDTVIMNSESRTFVLTIFKNIKIKIGDTVEIKFLKSAGIVTPDKEKMKIIFMTPVTPEFVETIEVQLRKL